SMQGEAMVSRCGIGMVAVAGASSALVSAADKVILMENYVPREITEEARRIAPPISVIEYKPPRKRVFYGIRGLRKVKLRGFKLIARYENGESFELDLSNNPRIVEKAQANLIAHIVASLGKPDEPMYVSELVRWVNLTLRERGFEAFVKPVTPDLALVDGIDVVWTLNRLRNASFSQ
ncbi:MAG TPA: ATP-binding protein, partial [Nitrososphaeria archaeon]|nr:ATP-binding protein [Nitrososphaeria archaeon]